MVIQVMIQREYIQSNIKHIEEFKLGEMKRSARIVDPFLHWREPSPAADFLLDNHDFLVVGMSF